MWKLVVGPGILFYFIGLATSFLHHGYLVNYYNAHRSVFVNDSMILELTNRFLTDDPKDNFVSCNVIVTTSASRRIHMHFLSLEISYDDDSVDRLHIFDYKSDGKATQITPPQGLYGLFDVYYYGRSRGVEDYVSTGNKLKLDYQGHPTLAYDGFKILVTTFIDPVGNCGHGYFLCKRKKICIPLSTRCDGFRNCGNGDNSDEAGCDFDPTGGWNPIDGTTMAAVTASLACTILLLAIGLVYCVVKKMNTMDRQNRNINVYFHKKQAKRQISKNGELVRLYAPPSYDVVIGMDDQPPPYQSVAGVEDSGSDVDEDDFSDHSGGACGSCSCVNTADACDDHRDEIRKSKQKQKQQQPTVRVTSALVVCDKEGNNIPNCPHSSSDNDIGFLKQTKYHLTSKPSTGQPNHEIHICHSDPNFTEIEIISSAESAENAVSKDKKKEKAQQRNGSVKKSKMNGVNGHARVNYSRSASKQDEKADIEFVEKES